MPLNVLGKTVADFQAAVSMVMRKKKISRKAAERYVGFIQHKQES